VPQVRELDRTTYTVSIEASFAVVLFHKLLRVSRRLHRLRCHVVVGGEFESEAVSVAESEGFGNLLLVGSALVATAHRLTLRGLLPLRPSFFHGGADSRSAFRAHCVLSFALSAGLEACPIKKQFFDLY